MVSGEDVGAEILSNY